LPKSIGSRLKMDLFGRNHIFDLSDEVLLRIIVCLNSLGTGSDLINLSQTSTRFNSLTEEKNAVSSLSFRRDFCISPQNLKQFFSSSLRCNNIFHINLNSCYFLSSTVLRSFLGKLKNLQSLHVADTSITASGIVSILMANPLLVNLSFSWGWSAKDAKVMLEEQLDPVFGRLKSLAVHVNSTKYCPLDQIARILVKCVSLERLVIFSNMISSDIATMPGGYNLNVQFPTKELRFPHFKEYICNINNDAYPFLMKREFLLKMSNGIFPSQKLQVFWDEGNLVPEDKVKKVLETPQLKTLYSKQLGKHLHFDDQKRFGNLTIVRYIHLCNIELYGGQNVTTFVPGKNNLKKLAVRCDDIFKFWGKYLSANVEKLEELLISQTPETMNTLAENIHILCENGQRIIGKFVFKNLRKFSVPICFFRNHHESNAEDRKEDSKKGLGRNSRAPSSLPETISTIFSDLAINVGSTLEHLELHKCQGLNLNCCGEQVLEQIEKLPKLKVLVLSKFKVNVGKSKNIFLKIFQSCSVLEELKIQSLSPHGNSQGTKTLLKDLSNGLPHAVNLKCLRIEQGGIMDSFTGILKPAIRKCVNLQKLVLVDPGQAFFNKFDISGVQDIISQNLHLRFFYIRCNLLTSDKIKKLNGHYKRVKRERPHLSCHFQRQFEDPNNKIGVDNIKDIPAIYINDMLPVSHHRSPIANITFEDVF